MNRITPEHLSRAAWVYVRQSTPGQVRHNQESQGAVRRSGTARPIWVNQVVVLMRSWAFGGGTARRAMTGFARPCVERRLVVLSLEGVRLRATDAIAYPDRYCGLVGCLLADGSSVSTHGCRRPLLLGMRVR